jgi:hypothetical protein
VGFFKRFHGKDALVTDSPARPPATAAAPASAVEIHSESVMPSERVPVNGRESIAELARAAGLGDWADQVAEAALQSVRLLLKEDPGDSLGTRFGGNPAASSNARAA